METRSLKALALMRLSGNQQGNPEETFCSSKETGNETSDIFKGAVEIITAEGERVWIVIEPEAVKLIPEGAVYFLGNEIKLLQKAGREAARVALNVKKIFGTDAIVEDVDQFVK